MFRVLAEQKDGIPLSTNNYAELPQIVCRTNGEGSTLVARCRNENGCSCDCLIIRTNTPALALASPRNPQHHRLADGAGKSRKLPQHVRGRV